MGKKADETAFHARAIMPADDFLSLGIEEVAYVKRVASHNNAGWAIFSADGENLGMMDNRLLAFAAILQHDLEPLNVH